MRSTLLNNASWANLVSHLGAIGSDPVWRIQVSAVVNKREISDEYKQKSVNLSPQGRCLDLYRATRDFLVAAPGYSRHKFYRDDGVRLVRRAVRLASHGIIPVVSVDCDVRHDRISLRYQIIGDAEVNS